MTILLSELSVSSITTRLNSMVVQEVQLLVVPAPVYHGLTPKPRLICARSGHLHSRRRGSCRVSTVSDLTNNQHVRHFLSQMYSYLTNARQTGVIAQEIGAAIIAIEHRYWGFSSPFPELTTENMQYLTLKNAIADLNYFALNAKLPFDLTGATNADKAPWVLVGGSYSGALAAWTEATTKPSVMWAYYASSAVVETIGNYWSYFLTEAENMPQNCSADLSLVIAHLDNIGISGTRAEQNAAKELFGFEGLNHYDDFME